jgi:hypothetical protein
MYFKDYWRPYNLFGKAVPSIEDVIFGASMIGLTLLVYPLLFKRREWETHHKRHAQFSLLYLLLGACLLLTFVELFKINSVIATGIVCVILIVPLLAARRDLAFPSLFSGLIMAMFAGTLYYILLGLVFKNTPWQQWLLNNTRLGIRIFGYIPLTELIWFFTMGSFLEAFDMYVTEAHFRHFAKNSKPTRVTVR